MKSFSMVLTCVAASFLTWWLTSSLVAHQSPRRQAAGTQVISDVNPNSSAARSTTTETGDRFFHPAPSIELGANGAFAKYYLRREEIKVEGGVATVSAHVSMADRRPGLSFLWRLRVVDANETPLAGRVYADQIFTLEENGQKEADFNDTVAVPQGARRVELSLFVKSAQQDWSFLDDREASRPYRLIHAIKLLTK